MSLFLLLFHFSLIIKKLFPGFFGYVSLWYENFNELFCTIVTPMEACKSQIRICHCEKKSRLYRRFEEIGIASRETLLSYAELSLFYVLRHSANEPTLTQSSNARNEKRVFLIWSVHRERLTAF
eukprot:TRINITY_DN26997_c0_g2_i2.p2 TRINITY_DN26997_c0_g2~~TRINITY_DN26997_c0_g2_i2.p2  ORF type:complete len:124 (-),score=0.97 TRINITY_DN26997_c0_g2_i2:332-703(-)